MKNENELFENCRKIAKESEGVEVTEKKVKCPECGALVDEKDIDEDGCPECRRY